jgi:hypothetical protein
MAAASVKHRAPALVVLMPLSRAPSRFTAVARSALPGRVRSKKTYSATMRAALKPTVQRLCAVTVTPPTLIVPSEKGGVREPSAPKKASSSPTSARCSATDTIRSTSVVASRSGWKTTRYSSGPSGTISSSDSST